MTSLRKRIILGVIVFAVSALVLSALVTLGAVYSSEYNRMLSQLDRVFEEAQQDGSIVRLGSLALDGTRITAMSRGGDVLYDSTDVIGYYLDQPDVIAALTKGEGMTVEASNLSGHIVACKSALIGGDTILRVCVETWAYSHFPTMPFVVFCLIFVAFCFVLAFFLVTQVLGPVQYASEFSRRIVAGDVTVNPRMFNYKEVQHLILTLQSMNAKITEMSVVAKQKSAELESIISGMVNGLIAVDGDLKVIRMNDAAKRFLGAAGSMEGRSILEATGSARLEKAMLDAMEKNEMTHVELSVRTNPGHRLIRGYLSRLDHEGETYGAVALLEDITDLRNLEQMRTDFAANVTHELKTPLTSIRGFVETLKAGAIEDPETAKYFLSIIETESDRLYRLINDILSVSSMESGRRRLSTERLSLGQYAQEVCEFLRGAAREKNIELTVEADENSFIQANKDHLKQLLINLVENAVKYTLEGGQVCVRVQRDGEQVKLLVRDTGIGIEQEHISRLFERFYRVDKGRSRAMGGTGLGLAIVKHIVQEMGGRIDVESKIGEGTQFTVQIPAAPEVENK